MLLCRNLGAQALFPGANLIFVDTVDDVLNAVLQPAGDSESAGAPPRAAERTRVLN